MRQHGPDEGRARHGTALSDVVLYLVEQRANVMKVSFDVFMIYYNLKCNIPDPMWS